MNFFNGLFMSNYSWIRLFRSPLLSSWWVRGEGGSLLLRRKSVTVPNFERLRVMENLEEKWQNLTLSKEEESEIVVEEKVLLDSVNRGKNSLGGKLHFDRIIRKEVILSTLLKVWKTSKKFTVQDIGTNFYIFSVEEQSDMQRVVKGKLWLFDSSLLSLKFFDGYTPPAKMCFSKEEFWVQLHNLPLGCMNVDIETEIGKSIGKVVECDVHDDDNA